MLQICIFLTKVSQLLVLCHACKSNLKNMNLMTNTNYAFGNQVFALSID